MAAFEQQWAASHASQLLAEAEPSSGAKDILALEEGITPDAARSLAHELMKASLARATIFYDAKDRLNYILVQEENAEGSCRQRIADINALLQGRGGGKDNLAQGSSPLPLDWQSIIKKHFDR